MDIIRMIAETEEFEMEGQPIARNEVKLHIIFTYKVAYG